MSVGVQRKARGKMAQRVGQCFDVYAVLQRNRCESVPLWHNKDKSENPVFAMGWWFVFILFPLKIVLKTGVMGGGKKPGLHIKDKFS